MEIWVENGQTIGRVIREDGRPSLILDLLRSVMTVLVEWDPSNPDHPRNT